MKERDQPWDALRTDTQAPQGRHVTASRTEGTVAVRLIPVPAKSEHTDTSLGCQQDIQQQLLASTPIPAPTNWKARALAAEAELEKQAARHRTNIGIWLQEEKMWIDEMASLRAQLKELKS